MIAASDLLITQFVVLGLSQAGIVKMFAPLLAAIFTDPPPLPNKLHAAKQVGQKRHIIEASHIFFRVDTNESGHGDASFGLNCSIFSRG